MNGCEYHPYPDTYHRKRIYHKNFSYYIYAVKIGNIFSEHLSLTEREELAKTIQNDQLTNRVWLNKSDAESIEMLDLYHSYYRDFHLHSIPRCNNWKNQKHSIDFFKFIQFGGEYTTNSPIHFYGLQPIEHVLGYNHSKYYAQIPSDIILDKTGYYAPRLFSYTLSVKKKNYLRSLELRFGEINGILQHDTMRHLLLNGVKNHLLWSGEFYFIFDYKYNKYVLIMDNASGHWRPNITLIPYYLEDMLIDTLFPGIISQYDTYRPLKMIGYKMKPWHRVKKALFPILRNIAKRDGLLNKQRKQEWNLKFAKWREEIRAKAAKKRKYKIDKHKKKKNNTNNV